MTSAFVSAVRRSVSIVLLSALSVAPVAAQDDDVAWSGLGHDSRDPLYRSPAGAVPTGTAVRLRLRALDGDLTAARVRVWNDRLDVQHVYDLARVAGGVTFPGDPAAYEFWEVTLPPSAEPTVYWYRFIAVDGTDTDYYEDDAGRTGGWGQGFDDSPDNSWQLTVFDPSFATPAWVKDAVIYQVFPDRFRNGNPANDVPAGSFFYGDHNTIVRSNGVNWNTVVCDPRNGGGTCSGAYSQNFYGGDLQGLLDRLDYLLDLGVTAIYLNPVFASPSNHRYDTADYFRIDDDLGDLALFQTLAAEVHARGMRLILDGVFNHVSSDGLLFDRYGRWDAGGSPTPVGTNDGSGACESPSSPQAGWFYFSPYTGGGTAPCSDGRAYESWFGYDTLPKLRAGDAGVRGYLLGNGTASVAPYWMQWADGWRLDVGGDLDAGTLNQPANDFWEDFRTAVRAVNPEAYIVGEEWGNATSWTIGGEWDATMNYQLGAAVLGFWRDTPHTDNDFHPGSSVGALNPLAPTAFNERVLNLQERYAPEAWQAMMNLLGSHDTNRALFLLDANTGANAAAGYDNPSYDWSDALTRLKGAALLQMTLPGAPTVYYGDEVGAVGPPVFAFGKWEDDPYNRVPYPWLDESGTPFYAHLTSAAAQNDVRDHYKALIAARNAHAALRTGTLDPLLTDDANEVYAYGRKLADDSDAAVVVVNGSGSAHAVAVDVAGYLPAGTVLTDALGGGTVTVDAAGTLSMTVPASSGAVLVTSGGFSRPAAVADLSAANASGDVVLGWSAAVGATSYDVYRSRLAGGGWQLLANTAATAFTDGTGANSTTSSSPFVARDDATLLESTRSNEAGAMAGTVVVDVTFEVTVPAHTPGTVHIAGTFNGWDPGSTPMTRVDATTWTYTTTVADGANVEYKLTRGSWETVEKEADGNTDVANHASTATYGTDGTQTVHATVANWRDPYVVGVSPAAGPGELAADAQVAVTWSQAMPAALAAFTLTGPGGAVAGTLTYDAGTFTHTFTPGAPLAAGSHTADVAGAVDAAGDAQRVPFTARFGARRVDVTFEVTVPAHTPGTVYVAGSLNGWNAGGAPMTRVDATTWTYTAGLAEGANVEFKLTRGSWETVEKEADGNTEVANRAFTATYGGDGTQAVHAAVANWRDPYVVGTTPSDGSSGLAANAPVSLTWNQAMPPTLAAFSLTGPHGAVAGSFSYDPGTFTHTFTPAAPFAQGAYTASVSGASDAGGDAQVVAFNAGFGALPVELVAFTAVRDGAAVRLAWETASETDNAGFEVEMREGGCSGGKEDAGPCRSNPPSSAGTPHWTRLAFVPGQGTTAQPQRYTYQADGLPPGTYRFRLKQVDFDGTFAYSPEVEADVALPAVLALSPAYPNPFNPTTRLAFTVPANGHAVLKVFDVLGREVATLYDGAAQPGRRHEVAFDAGTLATGLYLATLRFEGRSVSQPLLLAR